MPNDLPVLVTGGTGFTGGSLCRELLRRGQKVRTLVRSTARARELARQGVELIEGDLTDPESIDRAIAGTRTVYHVAAVFRTAKHSDQYYSDVNVGGVDSILASARKHGIERLVHCSTVGVHGDVKEIPADEQTEFNPGDVYQRTKLEGEQLVHAQIEKGLPASIFRPAAIYGPGDSRLLKIFRGVQRGWFPIFGSGETTYHLVYIDDLVDGIVLCGEHPAAVGEVFILAGDDYVTLNQMVELIGGAVGSRRSSPHLPFAPLMFAATLCEGICRPLGIEPKLHRRRCEFFIKSRAFTNQKAREMIGFRPKIDSAEGIRRTAAWYAKEGLIRPIPPRTAAA